jgi:hypothetical protein
LSAFETSSLTIRPGNGRADVQVDLFGLDFQSHPGGVDLVGMEEMGGQVAEVLGKLDAGEVGGLVETLVDKGHGADAALRFLEHLDHGGVFDVP